MVRSSHPALADYARRVGQLESLAKSGQIGSGKDFWLVKHNLFGDFEKVALMFGFANDAEFCSEVAELYMRKYPASRYYCQPVN